MINTSNTAFGRFSIAHRAMVCRLVTGALVLGGIISAILLSAATATEVGQEREPVAVDVVDDGQLRWPFAPTSARIHPLTRWLPPTEARPALIEVRVEFFDRYTHNVKGIGRIRFELFDLGDRQLGETAGEVTGRRLGVWEINLSDVERNIAHYDDITRTYYFRLQPEAGARLPERAQLSMRATWQDRRMSDTRAVLLR